MLKRILCHFLFFCLLGSVSSQACQLLPGGGSTPVVMFPHKFKENLLERGYMYQLVSIAIQKSVDKFGPCEPRLVLNELPAKRMELYLEQGDLMHLVDFSVTEERDKRFLAVPIPVYKGMVGYRIFFVRKNEVDRFVGVTVLKDLSRLIAGQGDRWADTKILRASGLRVNTTRKLESLYDMLIHSRFDYLPRGANEVFAEHKMYGTDSIIVEPNLVLSYPYMNALYVNKEDTSLRDRLTYGLSKAIEDGSFDSLFYSHPTNKAVFEKLHLLERRNIRICNPFLPDWVPLENDKYWLRPWPKNLKRGTACLGGQPQRVD